MALIKLEIATCSECPHYDIIDIINKNSGEETSESYCTKKHKEIDEMWSIPDWCPILLKK